MSAKNPTPEEREVILSHLKGNVEFKSAAKMLGLTDVAFAFRIVAYARLAVRRAEEVKNAR